MSVLIDAWDEAHRELSIAIDGTPDEDLWTRAHPKLFSVGELGGHVAYWQAVWALGTGDPNVPLDSLPIDSPLIAQSFRYYSHSVDSETQLGLTTAELQNEIMRIHAAAKVVALDMDFDSPYPGNWRTWGNIVQYQAFHVAYHTGQVYSVRHMLGHETEDN